MLELILNCDRKLIYKVFGQNTDVFKYFDKRNFQIFSNTKIKFWF